MNTKQALELCVNTFEIIQDCLDMMIHNDKLDHDMLCGIESRIKYSIEQARAALDKEFKDTNHD